MFCFCKLGGNAATCGSDDSVLVDSACEVHPTNRNLVEKSGGEVAQCSLLNITAARDNSLEHFGRAQLRFDAENGKSVESSFEVSEFAKPILSVSQLVDKGCRIVFPL